MKHAVVFGGSGFIPSHLCDRLLKEGFAVTALDNFVTGSRANLQEAMKSPHFELIETDVTKPLPREFRLSRTHGGVHGVFQMASPASPVDFDRIPFEILAVGSLGTFHAVELALTHGARLIQASTSEVYGDPLEHPQKETYWGNVNSMGPRACYDEAKRYGEALVSTAIRGVGSFQGKPYKPLNGAMIRIFNTYGPRMRPDDGRVVPEFCMRALKGEPLPLHGEGEQTRSFCYVSDLVDGIFKLFQSDVREAVNIGNPVEYRISDFADALIRMTGSKGGTEKLPARPDDPRRRCPDISKARKLLGWEPRVPLEEGLKLTLDYFRK